MDKIIEYYSRKDVQKHILSIAKNRELAVKFGEQGFGKRPDMLQFENDIIELVNSGATSFHFSEELWSDPLLLEAGMNKRQLDNLRIGWDLIIDVDSADFEYSRYATFLIIEALKFHNLKNFSLKFSGNKGFHIGIPFKAFPKKVNDVETKLLFPEGPRVIASYLKYIIKDHLTAHLLKGETIDSLLKSSGLNREELVKGGMFNPFALVDIDTVLISNRHMFRAPYSVNEKSGLVSLPIDFASILDFSKEDASFDKVDAKLGYLDNFKEGEATHLITQAFDWNQKLPSQTSEKIEETKNHVYQEVGNAIPENLFPPCMKIGLSGLADGKKRFLFILLNFLNNAGYGEKEIENLVFSWNKKNPEHLRENYITAQLSWHKRQKQKILPPNCDNQQYYIGLQICKPDNFCKLIKNPVHYAIRKNKMEEEKKRKSTKKK